MTSTCLKELIYYKNTYYLYHHIVRKTAGTNHTDKVHLASNVYNIDNISIK